MNFESKYGYDWRDLNPSNEVALTHIFEFIYGKNGDCNWLTHRNYDNETLLDMEQANLRQAYPVLFEQLDILMPQSYTPPRMEDIERDTKNYFRGATLSLLSMESSLSPDSHLQDITESYVKLYQDMDGLDQEWWLFDFERLTNRNTQSLIRLIKQDYILGESKEDIAMILSGARNTYVVESHFMACCQREKEISWITRDGESFEGWLAYRQDNQNN